MNEVKQSLQARFTSWWQSYEIINKGKMQIAQDAYSQGSSDFDAQRLRADTAEADLQEVCKTVEAVTASLVAAEQRISELEQNQPVKLPDRKSAVDVFSTYGLGEVSGWNKCLDALGNAFGAE